ncbi:tetratricopeptide repeat protein [Pseudomonas tohonis]|uniref:tetratricopeptide repeat protein n=1 Tax=Pseudomonas tohonis TaxID=2725477 RepID=UPI00255B89FE|nr:hypothetical protein [Pseudomonas tohonis]
MDFQILIQGLGSAASNPLAFGAYIVVALVWAFISYQKLYLSSIEKRISLLPEKDKIVALIQEGLKPKDGLTAKEYLIYTTRRYYFLGFLAIMAVAMLLTALGFQRYMELDKLKVEGRAINAAYEAFRRGTSEADDSNFKVSVGRLEESLKLNPTAAGYSNLSDIYDEIGEPDKAISASHIALKLDETNPTADNTLGLLYKDKKNFKLAESHLKSALVKFNNLGIRDDDFLASVLGNLGNVYYEMAEAETIKEEKIRLARIALDSYYSPALELKGSIQRKSFVAVLLGNSANCHRLLEEYATAESQMFESISLKEKILRGSPDSTALGIGYLNLADIYTKQDRLSDAERYVGKSDAIFKSSNYIIGLGSAELLMAEINKKKGDIHLARNHAQSARSIFAASGLDLYTRKAELLLASIDSLNGQSK